MVAAEAGERGSERKAFDVDLVARGGIGVAEGAEVESLSGGLFAAHEEERVGADGAARGLRDELAFGRKRERVAAGGALEKAENGVALLLRHEVQVAAALDAGQQALDEQSGGATGSASSGMRLFRNCTKVSRKRSFLALTS